MTATIDSEELTVDALRGRLGQSYTIQRQLGRGGMGAVYLAHDLRLGRAVAIKVLPPEYAAQSDLRERFLRETRMAASFSHPNIVPVFSIEDHQGLLAFAMGYVEGESLAERVKRSGPLSVKELVRVLQDIGYALAYAHGRGVVHRDIKPDNIMLERATGRALLMDFGIARTIDNSPAVQSGITRIGEVVGTPEFMSPEQASGDTVDGRSDLYSLGLVAWFAATGNLAISGESTQKVLVKQLTETIPGVLEFRTDLPRALADAIDRCTRKEPSERFATAQEMVDVLDAARPGGAEVPFAIRLFAEEASQAGLVLFGGIVMGVLFYIALGTYYEGNLDIILPVVLFGAVVWGRLTETSSQARRLALRGFTPGDVQRGLAALMAERDADRAQLRADPQMVARRRRQVIINVALFAATFPLHLYVLRFHRVELAEGYFGVRPFGAFLLYTVNITRGMTVVALLRSPLRRPVGEWLFRGFWLGPLGRRWLQRAARKVGGSAAGSATLRPAVSAKVSAVSAPRLAPSPVPARSNGTAHSSNGASGASDLRQLEARVEALERWRSEQR